MTRHQLIAEIIVEIQKVLDRWAKERGVVKESERVMLSIRVESGHEYWKMNPEEFFSMDRLTASGLSKRCATRVIGCVGSINFRWAIRPSEENGWVGVPKRKPVYKTMEEFLIKYNDARKLFDIMNLGKLSVVGMVKAIRDAGLHINDSRGLLN